VNRFRRDLVAALMLLTRLPVHRLAGTEAPNPAAAIWAYPLVGWLVGGIGALADWAGRKAGMPPLLAAVWTLAAMIAVTGGLHEDGLADTADGLGARGDALAVMRDSRIGTFGAIALILALGGRAAAIAALPDPTAALLAASTTGRAAMLILLVICKPARRDGLGATLQNAHWQTAGAGLAIAAITDWLLLPAPFLLFAAVLLAMAGLG